MQNIIKVNMHKHLKIKILRLILLGSIIYTKFQSHHVTPITQQSKEMLHDDYLEKKSCVTHRQFFIKLNLQSIHNFAYSTKLLYQKTDQKHTFVMLYHIISRKTFTSKNTVSCMHTKTLLYMYYINFSRHYILQSFIPN